MSSLFYFKKFKIDQTNCAMKVNTDGVLIAALADFNEPKKVLDVGTGSGLIALMLAQKYPKSMIHGVEINEDTANAARKNFSNSPFDDRIFLFNSSIKDHFLTRKECYDLIISNPPFFINSLTSQNLQKSMARHTDLSFFDELLVHSVNHLNKNGQLCVILPIHTAQLFKELMAHAGVWKVRKEIFIYSYPDSKAHRIIMVMGMEDKDRVEEKFVIYESRGVYSVEYKALLKDYFTIF